MGYGICYIGGLRNEIGKVDGLLGLPEGVFPLFGLCVGVPAEEPSTRPRLAESSVLFEERYPEDSTMLEGLASYDAGYSQYLADRGAAITGGWSSRMSEKYERVSRAHLAGYYRSKGARLD
jgi:FMN reductase (NADPH)